MRTVTLRATDLQTSRLGFGTSSIHHLVSSRTRQGLLGSAWDTGIRYFDTSPYYGHGVAERELGRFLATRRADAIVATKFGIRANRTFALVPPIMYGAKAAGRVLANFGLMIGGRLDRDYSAHGARRSLERSLKALRTDYVDILFLHEPALALVSEPQELAAELGKLVQEGKVRHIGVSGTLPAAREISLWAPPLGRIWQIDAAGLAASADAGQQVDAHITFGHFRPVFRGTDTTISAAERLRSAVGSALRINRDGVILFSTRDGSRVRAMQQMLHSLDVAPGPQ
jgi:hypothetical protein